MDFLRSHWYDIGVGFAVVAGAALIVFPPHGLSLLLWISLISLFLHQAEEYRVPGTFPGMMNRVMFGSIEPDRYPLNPNTALIINVVIGWLLYLLAALFGERLLWLGVASILVSCGNFIAHTFLFTIRGKTRYSPGMITAIVLFLPISVLFFIIVVHDHLARPLDWIVGIALGIALNYLGVVKMIDLLKDENTRYVFPSRSVPRP